MRTPRTLVLVDIENIVGHGNMTAAEVTDAWHLVDQIGDTIGRDHLVVATGVSSAPEVAFTRPSCRCLIGHGVNGADLELLAVLQHERVAARYDQVVLFSGDGIFTDAVALLAACDVRVTVVSRPHALSNRLGMAAARVCLLPELHAASRDPAIVYAPGRRLQRSSDQVTDDVGDDVNGLQPPRHHHRHPPLINIGLSC